MKKTSWFTVKKLYPQIWGIGEFDHFEKVISYLFIGKRKALLFDSGMGIGDINQEVKKITNLEVILVNSHNHYDHTGGNKQFKHKKLVKNGDMILMEPFKFEVIETPGHTPDSICLFEQTKGLLLTGDTFYSGPIYLQLAESSMRDYKKSIENLLKLSGIVVILPGHNDFSCEFSHLAILAKYLKTKRINPKHRNIRITDKISILLK